MSSEKSTSDSALTDSDTDSGDRDSQLSKRAFMHRLAVTAAATAPAGLAGCQSSGDDTDEATPTSTPPESGGEANSSADTPQQENVEISLEVADRIYNTESLSPVLENSEFITESNIQVTGPEDDITVDSLAEFGEQNITETAGEYQITVEYTTEDGVDDTIETTVDVNWLRPTEVQTGTWYSLMDEIESPEGLYNKLTEDGEFTETGSEVAQVLGSSDLTDDLRTNITNEVVSRDEIDEYDAGVLTTILNDPQIGLSERSTLQQQLPENFLERVDDGSDLTLTTLEKTQILQAKDLSELEHTAEIKQVRDQLIEDGYTQTETDYFSTVTKYDTETINGVYPRIEQAKEHGIFQEVLDDGEVDQNFLNEINDNTDNGLISARDPAPEEYSATPDPYPSGFVKDILGDDYDPEEPLAVFYYEVSEESTDDRDMIEQAIDIARQEYAEAGSNTDPGIQTLWIENQQPVNPMSNVNSGEELGEKLDKKGSNETEITSGLPAHYIIFDEVENGGGYEYEVWGYNTLQNAYVNTGPDYTSGPNRSEQGIILDALMAETLDNLVQGSFDDRVPYYREFDPDSEIGKRSWTSRDWQQFDPDKKEIPEREYDIIMEEDLNYSAGKSGQHDISGRIEEPIEAYRVTADRFKNEG